MLKRPLITEKSMNLAKQGFYTFEVTLKATKKEIAKLIAERFGVAVRTVKTIRIFGKTKMQRSRKGDYKKSDIKKAVVTLKEGQKIDLFEKSSEAEAGEDVEVRTAEGEIVQPAKSIKEKKSLLGRTKVKIEREEIEGEKRKGIERKREKEVKEKGS